MDKRGMYAAAVSGAPERQAESDGASYLRCQSVTEVQDGGVVIVRALVETHVVLQGVPQLGDKQMWKKAENKKKICKVELERRFRKEGNQEKIVPIIMKIFIWLSVPGCKERKY